MEKTLESLSFNIEQAFRLTPEDASPEEKKASFEATVKVREFIREISKLK